MVCDCQEARPFAVVVSERISFTKTDGEIASLVPKKGISYFLRSERGKSIVSIGVCIGIYGAQSLK